MAATLGASAEPDDSATIQDALYRITNVASAASDMDELYAAIHRVVGKLMFADNFFVALLDDENRTISFPYPLDEVDPQVPVPDARAPMGTGHARGLTAYVLRTGETQHVPYDRLEHLVAAGEVDAVGVPGEDWVGVPLKAEGKTIGALVVQSYKPEQSYTPQHVELLAYVGQHIASALSRTRAIAENSRLLAETNQRAAELEIVNEVGRALAKQLDFGAIVEAVGDRATAALGVRGLSISIVEPATGELTFYYWIDEGVRKHTMEGIVLGDPLSAEIMRTNRAVRIGSAKEAAARGTPFKIGGTESYLGVPIPAGDKAIGVFALGTREPQAYADSEERLLTTLASAMGVALENARLVEETRQRAAELSTVNEVGHAVAAQLDLDPLIQLVGEQIGKTFAAADVVYVALYDAATSRIEFPYYAEDGERRPQPDLHYGQGLTSYILASREALLLNRSEQFEEIGTRGHGKEAQSYAGVPIIVGDQAIGVISIQSSTEEGMFDEADRRLLSTLAANVGTAIQNARLFADVEQAKEAAVAANEAKSTFLASVSHELRTPLTSVLGFAKVIRRQLDERIVPHVDASDAKTQRAISQVRENVSVIVTEGERLSTLVNNVLDLAKIEAGRFEWNMQSTSMAEVIDRAVATTSGLFEKKGLGLRREVPDGLPEVLADRDGLVQVVINLLSNAVKFTERGSVTCRAGLTDEGMVVSVTDTGIGIARADQARVFQKFTQVGDMLTDKPHGTGLGLPICREIVERHGGHIWVQSGLGKGSTFAFLLPLTPPEPAPAASTRGQDRAAAVEAQS